MPLVIPLSRPLHHALLIGTGSYTSNEWRGISTGVKDELKTAKEIFLGKLEYDDCEEIFPVTDRSLGVKIFHWGNRLKCGKDDVVVVYYTGHGHIDGGGQLRLITSDVEPGEENTAIPATELVNSLAQINAHTLVIFDTCYSGAVGVDALVLLDRVQKQSAPQQSIQFITSASSIQKARPGWFIEALSPALDEVASRFDESRPMEKVLGRVNRALKKKSNDFSLDRIRKEASAQYFSEQEIQRILDEEHAKQLQNPESDQIARFSGSVEELSRFFPNRGRLEFKPGMDREQALRVLHSIQKDAFRKHWDPKARGVKEESEPGWFFSGRDNALSCLKEKVGVCNNSIVVVCGMSGSGKSALLARFVTLADPQQRALADGAGATKGVPATALPDPNSVDIVVWAKDRSVSSLVQEIATATCSDLHGEWEEDPVSSLANALRVQNARRKVLFVDALDEADKPLEAAFLLHELVQENCGLLMVVGIRSDPKGSTPLISRLNPFDILNLDKDEYWDLKDVACYVNRFLLAAPRSPYRNLRNKNYVREVADAVASKAQRSFLVATTAAQSLAKREKPIAREELPNLPTNAGEAFEMDLKRFKIERRQGIYVLGALAYGRGDGFPCSLWPDIVDALHPGWGGAVKYWEGEGGFYVSRSHVDGEEVCRLYHPEFTRYLRTKLDLDESRLVCRDARCSHSSPAACVAMVLLNKANIGAEQDKVSHHIFDYLTNYLGEAGLNEQLYELVTSERWHEIKNKVYQDPANLLKDLAVAMDSATHDPPDLRMLVRLSAISARQVTPASAVDALGTNTTSIEVPSVVISTLARAGQLGRARILADNVLFPLDRCHAYSMLAQWYHKDSEKDEALSCLAEAKRIAAAIQTDFRAMAFFWITHAAYQIGERQEALAAAKQAVSSSVDRESSLLGSFHRVIWAALCLRLVNDRDGLRSLKNQLITYRKQNNIFLDGLTNLSLQAASVTGDAEFLRAVLARKLAGTEPNACHPFPGNLELALVQAGMVDEFDTLERDLRQQNKWPGASELWADSGKRFVWALALRGRFDEALEIVDCLEPLEERARALHRISECAAPVLTADLQQRLKIAADCVLFIDVACWRKLEPSPILRSTSWAYFYRKGPAYLRSIEPWRIYSWLAPVYLLTGHKQMAMELCDTVCESGVIISAENSLCLPVRETMEAKHHITLALDPTADEKSLRRVYDLLAKNELIPAEAQLKEISSRRIRARCEIAIARQWPDSRHALSMVLDAIRDASRGGVGELKNILEQSRPVLARVRPDIDLSAVEAEFQNAIMQF